MMTFLCKQFEMKSYIQIVYDMDVTVPLQLNVLVQDFSQPLSYISIQHPLPALFDCSAHITLGESAFLDKILVWIIKVLS